MNNDSSAAAPGNPRIKPDLCLAVGVTGHRLKRLQSADLAALRATVAGLLLRLAQAANGVAAQYAMDFATTVPKMRFVSALADGADTIATEAALSAGWPVRRKLVSIVKWKGFLLDIYR